MRESWREEIAGDDAVGVRRTVRPIGTRAHTAAIGRIAGELRVGIAAKCHNCGGEKPTARVTTESRGRHRARRCRSGIERLVQRIGKRNCNIDLHVGDDGIPR